MLKILHTPSLVSLELLLILLTDIYYSYHGFYNHFHKSAQLFAQMLRNIVKIIKHCLNGRLSSSLQSRCPWCTFPFYVIWRGKKEKRFQLLFLTDYRQTQGIQSLSKKTEIFRLEWEANFSMPLNLNLKRLLIAVISSRLQWSKIVFLILLLSNTDVIYANIQYPVFEQCCWYLC